MGRRAPWMVSLFGLFLAGCLNAPTPTVPVPTGFQLEALPAFPIEFDHDHSQVGLHAEKANLAPIGYDSGFGTGSVADIPAGQGFSELFLRDHLAFLGRRGGDEGGFLTYDIQDPTMPKRLGAFDGLANYDMESTYDNKYVFFVSQYLNTQQPSSIPPDQLGELPRMIHIVDITDPTQPQDVGVLPVPTRGVHTITYYRTEAGQELVAAQTYDFLPDPSVTSNPLLPPLPVPSVGTNPLAQRVLLLEFKRTPAPHLELLSIYEKHTPETDVALHAFPHDTAIQKHPLTGQLLLYVAYWNLGGFLVDITDPTQPKDIAHLDDFSPSQYKNIHLVAPSDTLVDGRHLTITEPEFGGGETETGQYTLFDTTDPTHPQRLGYWTLPGGLHNDVGTRFSPHNFQIANGRLYLAHYHAGVWVVDIHDRAHQEHPEAVAFVQPNQARPGYAGDVPNVWTALYHDGYVFASDIATGLYVYHFPLDPVAAPLSHTH